MAITVDGNTRLAQLRELTSNADDAGKTLRAKHNNRGELVLYVKEGKSSFLDKTLGRAERREGRATEAVQAIIKNEMTVLRDTKVASGAKSLEKVAQTSIDGLLKTGEGFRTDNVKALASEVLAVADLLPPRPIKVDSKPGATGKSMIEIGVSAYKVYQHAVEGEHLSTVAAGRLGDVIADGYKKMPGVGEEDRHSFGRSGAMRLRQELTATLTKDLGGSSEIRKSVETFVDTAVNRAVSQMLPDQIVPNSAVTIAEPGDNSTSVKHTLPNITIGGQEFTPVSLLGKGGFGMAFEYQNVDNPSEKIALKLPLPEKVGSREDKAKAVADFAQEAVMHKKAQGGGSERLLGFKGEIRFPDGTLGLAMEIAPNGDAHKISASIGKMVANGSMTTAEANVLRLTMLKDMAHGLQHMAELGVQHLDFKSSNCFVGSDGTLKVADFGLTASGEEVSMNHFEAIPSGNYLAPEAIQKYTSAIEAGANYENALKAEAKVKIRDLMPGITPDSLRSLSGDVVATSEIKTKKSEIVSDVKGNSFLTSAADAWGLGASAIEMLTGFLPFESTNPLEGLSAWELGKYGKDSPMAPLADGRGEDGKPLNGSPGVKTGDAAIDELLTGLLQAKPGERYTADDVLESVALKFRGVGSDEAHALIATIGSGTPEDIEIAKSKLLWRMVS